MTAGRTCTKRWDSCVKNGSIPDPDPGGAKIESEDENPKGQICKPSRPRASERPTSDGPAVHGRAERKPEASDADDRQVANSGSPRAEPALPAEAFWKAAGRFARLR